ncbi:hypothetical protein Cni_G17644 [Canna indica]|uniref:Ribosome biogenesis protein slx9-like n=1 Tax=Canna indica TaxID=4628 RepID=A0AAQ3KN19_9LILI|nr:hypothetical protein Cni_G17644 [Canna indica]
MAKGRTDVRNHGEDKKRSSSSVKESKSFKRKLEKKEKFYTKVKDAVVSLSAKKTISKKKRLRSRQKKMKAYDLSALTEYLPNLDGAQKSTSAINLKPNCKNRQKLVQLEGAQLRQVLNDPLFQMDPLTAIHQHLQKTQPPACDKEQVPIKSKKNKKKVKRPSSGSQLMDM